MIIGSVRRLVRQRLPELAVIKMIRCIKVDSPALDWLYGNILFRRFHGRWPKRESKLISDYLFWRKMDEGCNRLREMVADKILVKAYVDDRIGSSRCVPTVAVLRSPAEIRSYNFPEICVIKPTHLSGRIIIRRRGEPVDHSVMEGWLKRNHYWHSRERYYKNLKPSVIVEPLLFGDDNITDYKCYCYKGRPRMWDVIGDRRSNLRSACFTPNWQRLPFVINGNPRSIAHFARPENIGEMLEVCVKVSEEFSFVRVDLYSDGRSLYVGELTNCPGNTTCRFFPRGSEAIASRLILREAG